jgi:hypothetical protein
MNAVERVEPKEVYDRMRSSHDLVLVCAYEDRAKCETMRLEGAITLDELEAGVASVSPGDQEIVFYCA